MDGSNLEWTTKIISVYMYKNVSLSLEGESKSNYKLLLLFSYLN